MEVSSMSVGLLGSMGSFSSCKNRNAVLLLALLRFAAKVLGNIIN